MRLEKLILEALQNGGLQNTELISEVQKLRPGTTKQGVYRILKKLAKDEIIILHNKSSSLNLNWIYETQEFIATAQFHYAKQSNNSLNFLTLNNKSKISYTFSNLAELDTFWNQVLYILNESVSPSEPLWVYNPHQWFFYSRNKNEQNLIKALKLKHRKCLVTLVYKDKLNTEIKRQNSGEDIQYAIEPNLLFDKPNYYFNIIGEFLIETFIDQKINDKLDQFFANTSVLNSQNQQELNDIIQTQGKHKMVITKSSKKNDLLIKRLKDKFIIK